METKTYAGYLIEKDIGEADDILHLSSLEDPLCEELEDELNGKQVTVRYWITVKECTKEQAQECFIGKLYGKLEAEYEARYSEYTGYLWTDEELKIGGHDLFRELSSNIGKWLILEINIHD